MERVAAIPPGGGSQDIKLRVDANQGWTAQQSVSIIRAMEDRGLGIELVEQPVPAHDLAGLKQVTQAVDTPFWPTRRCFPTTMHNGSSRRVPPTSSTSSS